jgi:hypothetical protein
MDLVVLTAHLQLKLVQSGKLLNQLEMQFSLTSAESKPFWRLHSVQLLPLVLDKLL